MSCPDCGETDKQMWSGGHSGRTDEPDADPGYECGYCGHWYQDDDPGGLADYLYDLKRESEYTLDLYLEDKADGERDEALGGKNGN